MSKKHKDDAPMHGRSHLIEEVMEILDHLNEEEIIEVLEKSWDVLGKKDPQAVVRRIQEVDELLKADECSGMNYEECSPQKTGNKREPMQELQNLANTPNKKICPDDVCEENLAGTE